MECPICNTSSNKRHLVAQALDVLNGDNYEYYHCDQCDVLYLESNNADEFIDHSASGYYSRRTNKFQYCIKKIVSFFQKYRVQFVKAASNSNSLENLSILDIGCGKGGFLDALKNEGALIHGLEPTTRSFEIAKEKLGSCVSCQVMSKEIFSESSIDVITMWHVFEHVRDPVTILDDCFHVLKKNGLIVIAVPNYRGWLANFGGKLWFNLDPPRHIVHYSEKSLTNMLEKSGFSVNKVSYHYPELTYFSFLQTVLNKLPITNNFLFNFLKRNKSAIPESRAFYIKDCALTIIAGALLFPFVIIGTTLTSIMKSSDCVNIVAMKK
jgi:2-polyprenyl-3-methyl-5-hydroxy-6-metoxy-1,4-benzoquinol methylase